MYNGGWIQIEHLPRFLDQFKPQLIHPDDPRWITFWRDMKKKCIEGVWFEDFGKWRYGRGNLGFYHWYCRIPDLDTDQKIHGKMIKPLIRDLEWHRSYYMAEAMGFSGFSDDDNYTSDRSIFNVNKNEFKISDPKYLRYFKSNGDFKEFIEPRENLFRLHDKPVGRPLYYNEAKNHLELGCLSPGTKVRMLDGSLKKVEDVIIGDKLMGPDGKERNVLRCFSGKDQMFKIKQRYLEDYVVNSKHPLVLKKRYSFSKKRGSIHIEETESFYKKWLTYHPKYRDNFIGIQSDCITYKEQETGWHPYFMGLWLGDGFKKEKMICLSKEEPELLEWLIEHTKDLDADYTLETHPSGLGGEDTYRFRLKSCQKYSTWFRRYKITKKKYIPNSFIINSEHNRLQLLAGLIDSDGHYEPAAHRFTITQSEKQLNILKSAQEVARSLGFRAVLDGPYASGVASSSKYNLRIYGDIHKIPTKVPRKQACEYNREDKRSSLHGNKIEIEPVGEGEFYGFELDGDHLFLLEDYTVTHNSRGGGKSVYYILGEVKYGLVFNSLKEYTEEYRKSPPSIKINVGAGIIQKSMDTLHFAELSMDNLSIDPECGTWGLPEDEKSGGRYEPCPFWKDMGGSFKTDEKHGWGEKLEVKRGSSWKTIFGSTVYHKSYSANKKTGAEAGAGGRRVLIFYEEIGLFQDMLNAWASDEEVVSIDGQQYAPRVGIGTSGNIETIVAARKIFTHPGQYNCLEFPSDDGESKQCFFLPAYIVDKRFKDSNGNTDLAAAKKFYEDKHEEKLKSNDSHIINGYKMNKPIKVDHMWVSRTGDLLPVKEAELREKQLLKNNLYESIGFPIKLHWDNTSPTGVSYEVDPSLEPFYDTIFDERTSLDGAVVMYEQPFKLNGVIPNDAHIVTHDPYVSDAWDEGGSLGVTHVWINPKYIPYGAKGNCLAATYIGKHRKGVDGYNETLEKLCAMYGNPFRGLWYEANRGERLRSYLLKRKKAYLMCLQPQFEQGAHIYLRNTNKTGFLVGSQIGKISMIDRLNEWLLEETQLPGEDEPVQNIFRLPCIFTIREIKAYSLKGNFDAVSSMLGLPLALGEIQHRLTEDNIAKKNPLGVMTKYIKQRIGA